MRSWRGRIVVGLLIWIAVVTWWALSPMTDWVPTGIIKGEVTGQSVDCDSPLSGNTNPTEPLPTLGRGRAFERSPCEKPVDQGRLMYLIDLAVVVGAIAVAAKAWKPPKLDAEPTGSDLIHQT